MKTSFLLSKALNSDTNSHLISINPISIYSLPECACISGDSNPELQEKAFQWYQTHKYNEVIIPRLVPSGYLDAIVKVNEYIELIDIAQLAEKVGVSEFNLVRVLNGYQHKGKNVHFSFRKRVLFRDEVEKLLL